jgi:hypothetical protein
MIECCEKVIIILFLVIQIPRAVYLLTSMFPYIFTTHCTKQSRSRIKTG